MIKKSIVPLLLVFCAAFLGSGDGAPCFGGDPPSVPVLSLKANEGARGKSELPGGPASIDGFHGVPLPSACLNGENGGGQMQTSLGRPTSLVRLIGARPNFIPGRFSHTDDIRSWFGLVRPHLYFQRLLI